ADGCYPMAVPGVDDGFGAPGFIGDECLLLHRARTRAHTTPPRRRSPHPEVDHLTTCSAAVTARHQGRPGQTRTSASMVFLVQPPRAKDPQPGLKVSICHASHRRCRICACRASCLRSDTMRPEYALQHAIMTEVTEPAAVSQQAASCWRCRWISHHASYSRFAGNRAIASAFSHAPPSQRATTAWAAQPTRSGKCSAARPPGH